MNRREAIKMGVGGVLCGVAGISASNGSGPKPRAEFSCVAWHVGYTYKSHQTIDRKDVYQDCIFREGFSLTENAVGTRFLRCIDASIVSRPTINWRFTGYTKPDKNGYRWLTIAALN